MGRGDGALEMPEIERFAAVDPAEPALDLHLWLIQAREEAEERWPMFDTVSAQVIRAATVEQAREIAARSCGDEGREVWLDPALTKAEQLDGYGKAGLILREGRDG